MTWTFSQPAAGDVIRVRAGSIYHYGIYINDGDVIQFGHNPASKCYDASAVTVISSDIDSFLLGGFLEVAVYDKKEQRTKKSPREIVETAKKRLGEGGYHILYNNCEHFVNECAFGEHRCSQVDDVRRLFQNMPLLDVYFCEIPDNLEMLPLYPKEREQEINSCSNERVKREKYCVWKLLEYAARTSFGIKLGDIDIQKDKNGKWSCREFFFSLSHSEGVAAVAVSKKPVGVDIEAADSIRNTRLSEKILSKDELSEFLSLPESKKTDRLAELWTKKESVFKRSGSDTFLPQKTETKETETVCIEKKDKKFFLSVANENLEKLHIFEKNLF